jgi:hypothetical protein
MTKDGRFRFRKVVRRHAEETRRRYTQWPPTSKGSKPSCFTSPSVSVWSPVSGITTAFLF